MNVLLYLLSDLRFTVLHFIIGPMWPRSLYRMHYSIFVGTPISSRITSRTLAETSALLSRISRSMWPLVEVPTLVRPGALVSLRSWKKLTNLTSGAFIRIPTLFVAPFIFSVTERAFCTKWCFCGFRAKKINASIKPTRKSCRFFAMSFVRHLWKEMKISHFILNFSAWPQTS